VTKLKRLILIGAVALSVGFLGSSLLRLPQSKLNKAISTQVNRSVAVANPV
jgi:hypothetical protein